MVKNKNYKVLMKELWVCISGVLSPIFFPLVLLSFFYRYCRDSFKSYRKLNKNMPASELIRQRNVRKETTQRYLKMMSEREDNRDHSSDRFDWVISNKDNPNDIKVEEATITTTARNFNIPNINSDRIASGTLTFDLATSNADIDIGIDNLIKKKAKPRLAKPPARSIRCL